MKHINLNHLNALRDRDYRYLDNDDFDIMRPKTELNSEHREFRINLLNRVISRIERDYQ